MKKKILGITLALTLVFSLVCLAACGGSEEKQVTKIEVNPPTKTEYTVGEAYDPAGGYITATYADGTTARIEFDAEGVEMDTPSTATAGKKTIKVRYGGQRTTFTITVNMLQYSITLDYNYEGAPADGSLKAEMNKPASKPTNPVRTGHSFQGWFTDETCTMEYDFEKNVTADMTLYARWLKDGASHDFTFDFNRTGIKKPQVTLKYAQGDKAVKYAEDPVRVGYDFGGWYTAAEGGTKYDFSAALGADVTVYAHWTKKADYKGVREYVFEAEETDLSLMSGPGLSSTASKGGMIGTVANKGASGNRYVGFLYKQGATVTFWIDSDADVSDAKLVARLSMEARNYTFNTSNYQIKVNDKEQDFAPIVFTGVPKHTTEGAECVQFKDYEIAVNVPLEKGRNKIELIVANNDPLAGTTITAAGPLVDCIKITTGAVLSWDGGKDLPMIW